MREFIIIFIAVILAGCNFINIKPGTMEKGETVFAERGGFHMRIFLKQELENRGYNVVVGKIKSNQNFGEGADLSDIDTVDLMDARYVLRTRERISDAGLWETFVNTGLGFVCAITFNGINYWSFNTSIADQKTGEEILAWSGRGCSNWQIRRFRRLMNELEK